MYGEFPFSNYTWQVRSLSVIFHRNDAKSVSIAALAAFHPNTKVQSAALHFFLGSETDADKDDESEDEDSGIRRGRKDVRKLEHQLQVGNHGRKGARMLAAAKKEENRVSTC